VTTYWTKSSDNFILNKHLFLWGKTNLTSTLPTYAYSDCVYGYLPQISLHQMTCFELNYMQIHCLMQTNESGAKSPFYANVCRYLYSRFCVLYLRFFQDLDYFILVLWLLSSNTFAHWKPSVSVSHVAGSVLLMSSVAIKWTLKTLHSIWLHVV
jgi:hypothetical protein